MVRCETLFELFARNESEISDNEHGAGLGLHVVKTNLNQLGGTITARAEPVRVGKRITVIQTDITGDDGKLLARVTTTHAPVGTTNS